MVAPLIAAGTRVAAQGAARGAASRTAAQQGTRRVAARETEQGIRPATRTTGSRTTATEVEEPVAQPFSRQQQQMRVQTQSSTRAAPEYRISTMTWIFMTSVAVVFDLLQILVTLLAVVLAPLAVLTIPITGAALCIFWLWFMINGVSYLSGNKMGLKLTSALSSSIVELVPVLSALPGVTIGVTGVIIASRIEDAEKAKAAAKKAAQSRPNVPANNN